MDTFIDLYNALNVLRGKARFFARNANKLFKAYIIVFIISLILAFILVAVISATTYSIAEEYYYRGINTNKIEYLVIRDTYGFILALDIIALLLSIYLVYRVYILSKAFIGILSSIKNNAEVFKDSLRGTGIMPQYVSKIYGRAKYLPKLILIVNILLLIISTILVHVMLYSYIKTQSLSAMKSLTDPAMATTIILGLIGGVIYYWLFNLIDKTLHIRGSYALAILFLITTILSAIDTSIKYVTMGMSNPGIEILSFIFTIILLIELHIFRKDAEMLPIRITRIIRHITSTEEETGYYYY
jgi:hypothetical protein